MLARLQAKTGCFWGAHMGGLCKCGSFDLVAGSFKGVPQTLDAN